MRHTWFAVGLLVLVAAFGVLAPPRVPIEPPAPLATATSGTAGTPSTPAARGAQTDTVHEAAAGPELEGAAEMPASATAAAVPATTALKKVGIQAGHWKSAELPDELAGLRNSQGTAGGGVPEWRLNLDIANKVAVLLRSEGLEVDILPATIPVGYQADAFVALHADGNAGGQLSGYKLARPRRSGQPEVDDALLRAIAEEYEAATGLPSDWEHVSRNMLGYYAFSSHRFRHAVSPTTPAVILEMGFMTNRSDLALLLGSQDRVAEGIARGILRFLD